MLTDFPVLYVDVIVRRTIVACAALGVAALAAGVLLDQPLAGVGVVLGLAGATVNHRFFQLSTARYSNADGHLDRKPYAGSVAARLGALTIIAFALLFLVRPMGFGMVGGLVAFQGLLMANAFGALWRYQRAQLAGAVPAQTVEGSGPGADGPGAPGPGQSDSPAGPPSKEAGRAHG
ncbi:MAG: hypothetical protein ABSE77_09095 [Acidimicrobiales bacterium]|jgi:hypothetical protein